MFRFFKKKEKGSLLLEQLLVMPFIVVGLWLIIQIILYTYANNQMNVATNDVASSVAHVLRGDPDILKKTTGVSFDQISLVEDNNEPIKNLATDRMERIAGSNSFILFSKNKDGSDRVIEFAGNLSDCNNVFKDNPSALCLFIEGDGNNSLQVIARSKAGFNLIGNFFSVLGDGINNNLSVYGNSSAPIDMPGRFNYYD